MANKSVIFLWRTILRKQRKTEISDRLIPLCVYLLFFN
ncbi:hypothetical protein BN135_1660 [Cronobacter muytjensii 530]